MSQWTHVAGLIVVDDVLAAVDPDGHRDTKAILEEVLKNPPKGSEGPLHYEVMDTGERSSGITWGNVSIWGDLRDFGPGESQGIVDWFKKVIGGIGKAKMTVRNAVLLIDVEYGEKKVLAALPGGKVAVTDVKLKEGRK